MRAAGTYTLRESHTRAITRKPNALLPPLRKGSVRVYAARRTKTATVMPDAGELNDPEQRGILLKAIVDKINGRFGKGSVFTFTGLAEEGLVTSPSGCLSLDAALGGGYPRGKVVEIFGPESCGKTTLALHAIAEFQKEGGVACFVDAEHAFDKSYAQKLGVDVDHLFITQPDTGEMALEVVDELCRSHAVSVIVIDSVSALVPRAELEGEIGQTQVGGQARLMSSGLRKLCASASKSNTTLIFINQLRNKVGVIYGNPETTSGGNALKFYSSIRIDVRRRDQIKGTGEEVLGFKTRAKIVKNKCAPPYREATFDLLFGTGIDAVGALVDAAEAAGVLIRRGAYYYHGSVKIAQGRAKIVAALNEQPELRARIHAETTATLKQSPDVMLGAGDEEGGDDGGDGAEGEEDPTDS